MTAKKLASIRESHLAHLLLRINALVMTMNKKLYFEYGTKFKKRIRFKCKITQIPFQTNKNTSNLNLISVWLN